MKKLTAIFTVLLLRGMTIPAMAASAVNKDGCYKGIKRCGRGKVVDSFPDCKIKGGESFPDEHWRVEVRGKRGRLYRPVRRQLSGYQNQYVNSFLGVE